MDFLEKQEAQLAIGVVIGALASTLVHGALHWFGSFLWIIRTYAFPRFCSLFAVESLTISKCQGNSTVPCVLARVGLNPWHRVAQHELNEALGAAVPAGDVFIPTRSLFICVLSWMQFTHTVHIKTDLHSMTITGPIGFIREACSEAVKSPQVDEDTVKHLRREMGIDSGFTQCDQVGMVVDILFSLLLWGMCSILSAKVGLLIALIVPLHSLTQVINLMWHRRALPRRTAGWREVGEPLIGSVASGGATESQIQELEEATLWNLLVCTSTWYEVFGTSTVKGPLGTEQRRNLVCYVPVHKSTNHILRRLIPCVSTKVAYVVHFHPPTSPCIHTVYDLLSKGKDYSTLVVILPEIDQFAAELQNQQAQLVYKGSIFSPSAFENWLHGLFQGHFYRVRLVVPRRTDVGPPGPLSPLSAINAYPYLSLDSAMDDEE